MKREFEVQLGERFPAYFVNHPCIISCGDGWFDVIFKLCEDIEKLNPEDFYFTRFEQKYTGLRIYCFSPINSNEMKIRALLNKAEWDASQICENCGYAWPHPNRITKCKNCGYDYRKTKLPKIKKLCWRSIYDEFEPTHAGYVFCKICNECGF